MKNPRKIKPTPPPPPPPPDPRRTKKEIAADWECSLRTVQRAAAKYAIRPVAFIGNQPVWPPAAVAELNARRLADKLAQLGQPPPKNGKKAAGPARTGRGR